MKKFLLFVAIPLIIIFTALIIFLVNYINSRKSKPDLLQVNVGNEVSPWGYASILLNSPPPQPTLEELDNKYQSIQESIENRDYESFKKVASTERVWHVENPKKLVSETISGESVYEALNPKGADNFKRLSPYSILFRAPKYSDLIPSQVTPKTQSSRGDIILKEDRNTTKVAMAVWRYSYDLVYRIKEDKVESGTGHVTFVWDKDAWKYYGEYWDFNDRSTSSNTGDFDITSAISVRADDTSRGCSPASVNIKVGEAVKWQNITGRIFSVPNSAQFWDSGYLNNDTFTKRFNAKGSYTYLIARSSVDIDQVKDCTVNVE